MAMTKNQAMFHRAVVEAMSEAVTMGEIRENRNAQPKETVLEEASRITGGDRQSSYGNCVDDFERIAGMWNVLFGGKGQGEPFKPSDVALAMCAVKLSRQSHGPKRDNWTDLAGYAHCGNQCDEAEGGDKPKKDDPAKRTLTAKQQEFVDSTAHVTVFYKSRGAGGTFAAKEAARNERTRLFVPSRAALGESNVGVLGTDFNPDRLRGFANVVIDNFNMLQPDDWGRFVDVLAGIRSVKIVCDVENSDKQGFQSPAIQALRNLSCLGPSPKSFRAIYANASHNIFLTPGYREKLASDRLANPAEIVFGEAVG